MCFFVYILMILSVSVYVLRYNLNINKSLSSEEVLEYVRQSVPANHILSREFSRTSQCRHENRSEVTCHKLGEVVWRRRRRRRRTYAKDEGGMQMRS